MKTIMSKFIILILLGFVGCKDEGKLGLEHDVDPLLVGDWYYFDTLGLAQPSPKITLHGMRVNADKTIQPLGIEFSTGRLALIENGRMKYILHANEGLLVIQYFAPPDIATDSLYYAFGNSTLILTQRYFTSIYQRTNLGSYLATPEQTTMVVTIDSTVVRSPSVGTAVPVYVSRLQASRLQFNAVIPNGVLKVDIDSFAGVGNYAIGAGKGTLLLIDGDVAFYLTTDSLSAGTIEIDQYDEVSGHCSGRFAFTARLPVPPNDPQIIRRLSGGSFSAPLYR
jgi:hypothetical protein